MTKISELYRKLRTSLLIKFDKPAFATLVKA